MVEGEQITTSQKAEFKMETLSSEQIIQAQLDAVNAQSHLAPQSLESFDPS